MEPPTAELEWIVPDDLPTHYATTVVTQNGQHEVYLLFFEARLPIVMGSDDKAGATPLKIPAQCVSRIAISDARLSELVEVLVETLAKRNAIQEAKAQ